MNNDGPLTFWLVVLALYFLPVIVARMRQHRQLLAIGMLNLFAGWTFIGWVAAIVWACTHDTNQQKAPTQ